MIVPKAKIIKPITDQGSHGYKPREAPPIQTIMVLAVLRVDLAVALEYLVTPTPNDL